MHKDIISLVIAVFGFTQCVFSYVMPGQDEIIPMRVEETFTVQDFHRVVLDVPGDLLISQADRETLTIEGQKVDINRVGVLVNGDTLYIRPTEVMTVMHSESDLLRPLVFELAVKRLNSLQVKSGTVQMDGLRSDDLTLIFGPKVSGFMSIFVDVLHVMLTGETSLQLRGVAKRQEINCTGTSFYTAIDVQTNDANVVISGQARASINIKDQLAGTLKEYGTLYYSGIPLQINVNVLDHAELISSSTGSTRGAGKNLPGNLTPKAGTVPPYGGIAPPGNTPAEQRPPGNTLNQYF